MLSQNTSTITSNVTSTMTGTVVYRTIAVRQYDEYHVFLLILSIAIWSKDGRTLRQPTVVLLIYYGIIVCAFNSAI
jgi:hypothetical protein